MCTQCTRNIGTTFVSHTKHWKTPQHRQHREKQENHVVFHCHIGKSQLLAPSETSKTTQRHHESALMCTQCARNVLGTTIVSHTQPWKTPQHTQNREKQENHVVSLSYREIAISSPFRDPTNDPEASISTESALMCTQCTRKLARNTFWQPYQPLENTTTSSKSWKTRKSRYFTVT